MLSSSRVNYEVVVYGSGSLDCMRLDQIICGLDS
jgi:hypothetical protein